MLARKEELGKLLSREEGKPLANGIAEVMRAGQIFKFFAQEALRIEGVALRFGAAWRRYHRHARAGRRRRPDLPVEFSDCHSGLEDGAGARLRQHGGDQACRPGAGIGLGAG